MINQRMIVLAREAEGLTQSALAHSIQISQALLSRIEHGLDQPNDSQVAAIARECNVPIDFFVQPDDVLGEGLVDFFHRKRLTLPAKPLKKAHALANIARLEIMRLLRLLELTDVAPLPTFTPDQASPTEIAAMVRATWRVPRGPLPNLIELIEAAGSPVLLADLGHEKLSAISMPAHAGCYVVLLNSALPASHQRWSLAHELGHLVMHGGPLTTDMEREADEFASALLLPADDVRSHLRNLRFRDLGALKPIWEVSLAALIRTAHDLGELSDRQYRWFNMQLNKLPGGRKHEPGEFRREEPRLIRHLIEHYRKDLGYSMADIARLMVTTEDTVATRYLGETRRTLRSIGQRHLHSLSMPEAMKETPGLSPPPSRLDRS